MISISSHLEPGPGTRGRGGTPTSDPRTSAPSGHVKGSPVLRHDVKSGGAVSPEQQQERDEQQFGLLDTVAQGDQVLAAGYAVTSYVMT